MFSSEGSEELEYIDQNGDALSLETFNVRLDIALSRSIYLKIFHLIAWGLDQTTSKGSFKTNYPDFMIP